LAGNLIGFAAKIHPVAVLQFAAASLFDNAVYQYLAAGNAELCLGAIPDSVGKLQQLGEADGFSFYAD
jgi:hypothetical protein